MDFWKIEAGKVTELMAAGERLPEQGFGWLDLVYDEVDLLQAEVERLTGLRIFDVHIGDAKNLTHPFFTNGGSRGDIIPIVRRQTGAGEREDGHIVRRRAARRG